MADAKGRHDWDMTSLMWATLANTCRDSQRKPSPYLPSDVHPYRDDNDYKPKPVEADISVLKLLLPHG